MSTPPQHVHVFETRAAMGAAAGQDIADALRQRLASQDRVRIIFAAAPSQNEVLDALAEADGIDWSRVDAFHMDEYIGLPPDAPERFGSWLNRALFDRVPFGSVHLIDASDDTESSIASYTEALAAAPIDIVCCGIGNNAHIAFNDPPVADFEDPSDVKVVELDLASRQQQVDDDCFASLEDVPTHALTLTIPRLLRADAIFCIVPGPNKANAVRATLTEPISPAVPATVLRTHANCHFYFDSEAAKELTR